MADGGPDPAALTAWVQRVHGLLSAAATECSGALWGPVALRHRTVRPAWFSGFDQAWAVPLPPADGSPGEPGKQLNAIDAPPREAPTPSGPPAVDLITAAFSDLPLDLSPAPLRKGDLGPRGEVLALADTPLRMVWEEAAGQVLAWDRESGAALMLTSEAPNGYEVVSPTRFLVHWATAAAGGVLMHGATVGLERRPGRAPRGLLLLGEAGYGKSTSALACLQHGWVTCGDDAVAVFPDDLGWRACAIYAAVKTKLDRGSDGAMDADQTERQPGLPASTPADLAIAGDVVTWTIDGRKRAHHLTATDAQLLAPAMRLDGLVLLDPAADPDDPVVPVSASAARTLAAPSTTLPMPFERLTALTRIGSLASELPAFVLPRRAHLDSTVKDLAAIAIATQPEVSVVVPVYNGEAFVADALRSIADQDAGQFQVIVVDDASTDDSLTVVEAQRGALTTAGHALVVLRHSENTGVGGARNTGIRAANGAFVSFLDQDDLWPADRTERLHAALVRDRALAAFGRMTFTDISGADDRHWVRPEWFESDHPGRVLGASLLRREVFDTIGLLKPELRSGYDDVDWLMRLRDSSLATLEVPATAVERRIHDRNQSRTSARGAAELLATVRAHRSRLAAAAQPLVQLDVVVPVHHVSRYLRAAVDSALRQRGADVRVVVVDDGSREDIADLVDSWHEPRVTLVRHDRNRGIGAARNTGAAAGERPWLGFLDSDDLWPLDRTRQMLSGATGTELLIGQQLVFNDGYEPDPARTFEVSGSRIGPLAGAMLLPRGVFERLGPFDEELRLGEFIDWIARARTNRVRERQVACVSLLRRSHDANTTRTRTGEYGDYLKVVARARARTGAAARTSSSPTAEHAP